MEIISNITLYKDTYFSKEWQEILGEYELQIVGEKARVKQYSIFGKPQQSRLNKLRWVGCIGQVQLYHLVVNGQDAFLKLDKRR
jgi:hypothetical protein